MQVKAFGMQWFQEVLCTSFVAYVESFMRWLPHLILAVVLLGVGWGVIRVFRRSVERVLLRLHVAPNSMQLTL